MPVQDSFIALRACMLAVRLWFILFILVLSFCLILGADSGFGADALVPALIWFVFFFVWFCVWLAW